MVKAVREGAAMRAVARRFGVSLLTVQRWVQRSAGQRLDRSEWDDRSHRPHRLQRTPAAVEERVVSVRQELKVHSDLGEFGAAAIGRALRALDGRSPSVRTIGRILERTGTLDGRRRVRRPPPPRGWYLPAVAASGAELDSFDIVEGLVIRGGLHVEVLNAISLHGGLPESWPTTLVTAKTAVAALLTHWRAVGLPHYAQFDNDTIFQGPHQLPDVISRVMRICLSLGVVPVFAPPREPGFQAAIESFNGRWQAKVWTRFEHESLAALQTRSARYITALRQRSVLRIEAAPARHPFPAFWQPNLQAHPTGQLMYMRRTTASGAVNLLGHTFAVDPCWAQRLVRCEVDLDASVIRFHALRRRQPTHQPLLTEVPYVLPRRHFKE
jgi:transposase-like protein